MEERCTSWANDGDTTWNAKRCAPILRQPDPLGAPCTVEGSAVSGIDTCELGALCWNVDPITLEGTCAAICTGTPEEPLCEDPDTACMIANDESLALCLRTCDPLLQDCERSGEVCVPTPTGSFACVPPGGALVADGEPCEHLNVCASGSTCADAATVPGCEGSPGCCTPFCDITAPEPTCTTRGTECVPWYPEGQAPGLEALGICSAVPGPAQDLPRADQVQANIP